MKQLLPFLLCFSFVFKGAAGSDTKADSKIEKVTVYTKGAQIFRTADLSLKRGVNKFIFTNLTSSLDANTIQIKGTGNCMLLTVNHQLNFIDKQQKSQQIKDLEQQVNELKIEIEKIKLSNSVLEQEEKILLRYQLPIDMKEFNELKNLTERLDFYRNRLNEIREKRFALQLKNEKNIEKANNIIAQLNELRGIKDKPTSEIELAIETKKDTTIKLEISYYVAEAYWRPLYDLRCNSISKPLVLTLKANVNQNTGEDWNDVKLTLATANPAKLSIKPAFNADDVTKNAQPATYYINEIQYTDGYHGKLIGKITDASTNEPIPFVNLIIEKNNKQYGGATTDFDGNYCINPIEPGKYELKCSYVGYKPIFKSNILIYANQLTSQDIRMEASAAALTNVEIIAYKVPLIEADNTTTGSTYDFGGNGVFSSGGNSVNIDRIRTSGSYISNSYNPSKVKKEQLNIPHVMLEGPTNYQYVIDIPYAIPSEGKDYLVNIKDISIPVLYNYHCAPIAEPGAFLMAKITNWEELQLLPGNANLFFEGSYIGKSEIKPSTDYTLEISLGMDASVISKREKIKEYKSKRTYNQYIKENIGWEITLKNTKSEIVQLTVEDQLPISSNNKVSIEIQDISNAQHDTKSGKLSWNLSLMPGESKKLTIKYEIKYPQYMRLNIR